MKIGIIEYGIGNIGSLLEAFRFYNYDVSLVGTPKKLKDIDMIVLAGVGDFSTVIKKLKRLKMWDELDRQVKNDGKPVLGICLGMQLFSDLSYENGKHTGFGWIAGDVVKLKSETAKVPHIGWDKIKPDKSELFKGIRHNYFYYMHSYHFVPKNKSVIAAVTSYGPQQITAVVRKDNIVGVQFHPEKSQGDGLRFLKNTVEALT